MQRILALTLFVCSALCAGQIPRTGDIDFYGLHKVTPAEILAATGIQPGGPLPPSKGDAGRQTGTDAGRGAGAGDSGLLRGRPRGVVHRHRGARRAARGVSFRAIGRGDAAAGSARPLSAVPYRRSARRGSRQRRGRSHRRPFEDGRPGGARVSGRSLWNSPPTHLDVLRNALHNGSDPDTRAAAAAVIGYGPKTQAVVDELQFALDDPEPGGARERDPRTRRPSLFMRRRIRRRV